jgi:hypothetical protein
MWQWNKHSSEEVHSKSYKVFDENFYTESQAFLPGLFTNNVFYGFLIGNINFTNLVVAGLFCLLINLTCGLRN